MLIGETTTLNIATVLAVISTLVMVGGIIWRLSEKVTSLKTQQESNNREVDFKISKLDSDMRHLTQLMEIKISHAEQVDTVLLRHVESLQNDMKSVVRSIDRAESSRLRKESNG